MSDVKKVVVCMCDKMPGLHRFDTVLENMRTGELIKSCDGELVPFVPNEQELHDQGQCPHWEADCDYVKEGVCESCGALYDKK